MTRRIDSPDTDADRQLRASLDETPSRSFIMIAGAGSGKTTSLVKALRHLDQTKGTLMRKQGCQIACITFTEVAAGEVRGEVGDTKLFHVSTIHSFLWTLVSSFQVDIREWVAGRITHRMTEAQEHLNRPRTRASTKARLTEDLARYSAQLAQLPGVMKFKYGTGSSYGDGVLGHDDVISIGPALIEQYPLLRSILARRFPYVFVDESQDTTPEVVTALRRIATMTDSRFCLGFFGDPMQRIYLAGVGSIAAETGWNEITKPENFRCSLSVLRVVNAIRAEDDGFQQVPAARVGLEGAIATPQGTAKLFVVSSTADRSAKISEVREWMATNSGDPLWGTDEVGSHFRLLVLVHRSAAQRLGFPELYAALNDHGSNELKDGLAQGTAWVLRPFLSYLLPLIEAENGGKHFEVMQYLRENCPLLTKERLADADVGAVLTRLQTDVTSLARMLQPDRASTIRDILLFVHQQELAKLDDRFVSYLAEAQLEQGEAQPEEAASGDDQSVLAFLGVCGAQLWGYQTYIRNQSPFSTQQGVKGAEFDRVLVMIDGEEAAFRQFSYAKYWGLEHLSETDRAHIAAHEDSVIARTRRLFYVCCSRARKDLAVILSVADIDQARALVDAKGIFPIEDIHVL